MSEDCDNILLNPLQRDGTHQRERLLAALKPDSVKVDERDIDEWLLYANRYAALLRFYDVQNIPDGDWTPFIQKDVSTLVAMVANADQQTESYKRQFDFYMLSAAQIETTADSNRIFSNVLVVLYNMASQLFTWQNTAIPELALQKTLDRLIASLIDNGFTELIGYLERAKELGMPIEELARIRNAQQLGQKVADTDPVFIDIATLRARWPEGEFPPQAIPFTNGIPAPGKNVRREVRRLTTLFRRFYEVMKVTVRRAPEFMEESLTEFPSHEPHMALFLTFLNLMKVARDHLNTLTKRHLDFYYQEVLQLEKRPETPDKVHLIFELANNFKPHLVEADAEFAAGSDDLGNDLFYAADEELVVNQAKLDEVDGLKTIFIDKKFTETTDDKDENELTLAELGKFNIKNIHAAPNADTADGKEEDLPEDNPKWETLGSGRMPHGEIGFAIASPMLLLGEGTRTITLTFTFPNLNKVIERYGALVLKSELRQNVKIFLTGEKDWFEVKDKTVEVQFGEEVDPDTGDVLASRSDVVFQLELLPDDPAVVPYDPKVYSEGFSTRYPVIRFLMDNEGLETNGDLDLNLAAGIEEYNASIPYLANEFVKISNEPFPDFETIFRSNADVQAVNPNPRPLEPIPLVWESISEADAIPINEVTEQSVGLLVLFPGSGGNVFRLNVDATDVNPDAEDLKIWKTDIFQNQGNFDPEETYTESALVSFQGKLYELIAPISEPIAPSSDSNSWREVLNYSDLVAANAFLPGGKMCKDAGSFFIARVSTQAIAGEEPSVGNEIWKDIVPFVARAYEENEAFVDPIASDPQQPVLATQVPVDLVGEGAFTTEIRNRTVWTDITYVDKFYAVGDLAGDDGRIFEALIAHNSVTPPSEEVWTDVNFKNNVVYGQNSSERVGFEGLIYKANAVPVVGIAPDNADPKVWISVDFDPGTPYDANVKVGFNGELFETLVSPVQGTLPNTSLRAWLNITYDSAASYKGGDMVVFDPGTDKIYQVFASPKSSIQTEIFAGEPVWKDVTYKDSNEYEKDDEAAVLDNTKWILFKALGDVNGVKPVLPLPSGSKWSLVNSDLKPKDFDADSLVSTPDFPFYPVVDTFVAKGSQLFKTILANVRADFDLTVNGMTEDATLSGEILRAVSKPFSVGQFVAEPATGNMTAVFIAQANDLDFPPDANQRIWRRINAQLSNPGDGPHIQGDFVRTADAPGGDVKVFRVHTTVTKVNGAPSESLQVWEEDTAITPLIVNAPVTLPAALGTYARTWEDGAPHDLKDSIIYKSNFVNVTTQPKAELWGDHANVSTAPFAQGDFAEVSGSFFLANATPIMDGNSIAPDISVDIFTEVPAIPYVRGQNINAEAIVSDTISGTTSFFQCQGEYIAAESLEEIPPSANQTIWKSTTLDQLPAFDPVVDYNTSSGSINVAFASNTGVHSAYELIRTVDRFGPSRMPEVWQQGGNVQPYDPTKEYTKGTFVSFVGSFFEARATFTGIVPTSGLEIWEEVDFGDVEELALETYYPRGAYVKVLNPGNPETYFRAGGGVTGISPEEGLPIWEKEVEIIPYLNTTNYSTGDYVHFDIVEERKYFRSLFNGGNVNPLDDPTLWSEAGAIDLFNKADTYYRGMHILFEGVVYRALRNLTDDLQGVAPDLDAANDPNWKQVPGSYPYKYFRDLAFEKLVIDISVLGMSNLILENDQGVINADKPFRPFGTTPKKGGNFYIGSHEIFQKRMDGGTDDNPNISIELEWGDTPEVSFKTYYADYVDDQANPIVVENNQYFTYDVEVLQDGNWEDVPSYTEKSLFEDPNSTENSALEGDDEPPSKTLKINIPDRIYKDRKENLLPFSAYSLKLDRGFIRFSLEKDFFHGQYAKSIAHQVSLEGNPTAEDPDVLEKKIPNEPYTPLINSFTLCYHTSETLNFKGKGKGDAADEVEQFFHIHPFGQGSFYPINEEPDDTVFTSDRLVPIFDAPVYETDGRPLLGEADAFTGEQAHVHRDASGNLYIGIRDLQPPQNLHMLFQVAEGSENPDRAEQRVIWSYLRHNRWIDFKDTEILSDGTDGLLGSGIIKFSMPKGMKKGNSILPGDLHWIKASVVDFADGVAQALAVRPQAILASYRNRDNDPTYLKDPLEADQISSLVRRRAEISKIEQPYASFDGRLVEQDEEFYVRVSERLRHKSRGITIFDYERIVLEQFPDVYKVKCINHTYTYPGIDAKVIEDRYQEFLPGHVKLIVLPDLRNKNAVDRLRPRMSLKRMKEIYEYIQPRTSNFLTIAVKAPIFEEVRVTVEVVFNEGKDVGFFTQKLNEDLIAFLSPWLFDDQEDIVFGGKIRGSEIMNFIDEQDYIDYITDFRMEQRTDGEESWGKLPELVAVTCTSSSVLVSAGVHIIQVKTEEKCQNQLS